MSQLSRKILSSRGNSLSPYPMLRQRQRPQTLRLRDRLRIGTRTWTHCTPSHFPFNFMPKSPFSLVQPSSHFTFRLYAKRSAHPNILIGTHEMPMPLASQSGSFFVENSLFNRSNIPRVDIPCVLGNDVGEAAGSTPPVTLYITITKNIRLTLRVDQAGKAMKQIVQSNTWEGAVERIKWVMDTLGPVAEVRVMVLLMSLAELTSIPSISHSQRWRTVYFWQFPRHVHFCHFPNQILMLYLSGW